LVLPVTDDAARGRKCGSWPAVVDLHCALRMPMRRDLSMARRRRSRLQIPLFGAIPKTILRGARGNCPEVEWAPGLRDDERAE